MIGTRKEREMELKRLYPVWEPNTIWTMFRKCCERSPDADFIVTGTEVISYRHACAEIDRTAKGLCALGVKKGSHVALAIHNCPEYLFFAFALARLGAVKIAVNPNVGSEELAYILTYADVEVLICEETMSAEFLKGLPCLQKTVCLRETLPAGPDRLIDGPAFYRQGQAVSDGVLEQATQNEEGADEVSDMTFTSGSTDFPKGVMLTHDMLLRTAYGSCISRLFEIGRRICVPVPLYHNLGYVEGVLAAMLVNGAIIISTKKVTSDVLLHMLTEYGANDLLTVPTQVMDFFDKVQVHEEQLRSLHAVYSSAGTCPDWIWGEIRRRLFVTDVITAFGMTEVTASTMQTRPDDPEDYVIKYVGTIKPGGAAGVAAYHGMQCEYKVVDLKNGEALPAEMPGELCCRGKTVMKGYYKHQALNEKLFDAEGWFHTSDIGIRHKNGYFSFVGRGNDSYKINGELVSPQFVDRVISRCSLLRAAEVVGIKHEKCGAIGVAFIDAYQDSELVRQQILDYCKAHLAPFQVPRYFIFSPQNEWPKTAVGKVQKYRLRDLAKQEISAGHVWPRISR